jgi:hypothetical protein
MTEAKTQLDGLQPLIGMTSLKSPEETSEYRRFDKVMKPENLSHVTKELNKRDDWVNDLDEI